MFYARVFRTKVFFRQLFLVSNPKHSFVILAPKINSKNWEKSIEKRFYRIGYRQSRQDQFVMALATQSQKRIQTYCHVREFNHHIFTTPFKKNCFTYLFYLEILSIYPKFWCFFRFKRNKNIWDISIKRADQQFGPI